MREAGFTPFAVGHYRCEERLRAGGTGEIFLAVHLPTGKRRALWRLPAALIDDPASLDLVMRTLLTVQDLSHPNLVVTHEIMRAEGNIYVVTDHTEGVTLHQVLVKLRDIGPFPPPVATFIVWQLGQALDAAHHLKVDGQLTPIVHGAVWPQNVLISTKGEVRLTGFGTWVPLQSLQSNGELSVRTLFGYRSPEHVTGEPLTPQTDLFCLGILLYEMLTAKPLFVAPTLMETVQRVERADLGDLSEVPSPVEPTLRRCLQRRPADRFPDVAAFVAELEAAAVGMGDRPIRQQLEAFVESHFGLAPSSSVSPDLHPAPLPGQEEDVTTNVRTTGLTEALLALSREATATAESPPQLIRDAATQENADGDEPTAVDSSPPDMIVQLELAPAPATPGETDEDLKTEHSAYSDIAATLDKAFPEEESSSPTVDAVLSHLFPVEESGPRVVAPIPSAESPLEICTTDETTNTAARRPSPRETDDAEEEPTPVAAPSDSFVESIPTRRVPAALPGPRRPEGPTVDERPGARSRPDAGSKGRELGAALRAANMAGPTLAPRIPARASARPPAPPATAGARPPGPQTTASARPPGLQTTAGASPPGPQTTAGARPSTLQTTAGASPPGPQTTAGARPPTLPAAPGGGPPSRTPPSRPPASGPAQGAHHAPPTPNAGPVPRGPFAATLSPAEGAGKPTGPLMAADSGSYSDVSTSGGVASAGQPFDADAYSASIASYYPDLKRRPRISPAHIMLAVAISVFLVAVALLVRRVVSQRLTPQRPDAQTVRADASPVPSVEVRRDLGPSPAPGPQTGKHLEELLQGRLGPGQMRVTSEPQGTVYVDRKLVGRTPTTVRVPAGSAVEVLILASGYEMHRATVRMPSDKGYPVQARLTPAHYPRASGRPRGILAVRCPPGDDRRISIDGRESGYGCPKVKFALRPARYRIGLYSVEEHRAETYTVRVRNKRRTTLHVPPLR